MARGDKFEVLVIKVGAFGGIMVVLDLIVSRRCHRCAVIGQHLTNKFVCCKKEPMQTSCMIYRKHDRVAYGDLGLRLVCRYWGKIGRNRLFLPLMVEEEAIRFDRFADNI